MCIKCSGKQRKLLMENLKAEIKEPTLDMVAAAPVVKENSAGPWRLRQSLIRSPAVPVRWFPRERAKVSKFTAR